MGVCIGISFNSLLVKAIKGVLQVKRDRISQMTFYSFTTSTGNLKTYDFVTCEALLETYTGILLDLYLLP